MDQKKSQTGLVNKAQVVKGTVNQLRNRLIWISSTKKWFMSHIKLIALTVWVTIALVVVILVIIFSRPVAMQYSKSTAAVNSPISVSFKRPVRRSLAYSIEPRVDGRWQVTRNILGGVTQLTFIPKHTLAVSTVYKIRMHKLQSILSLSPANDDKTVLIKTEKEPSFILSSPNINQAVLVTTGVTVRLQTANHDIRKLRLASEEVQLKSSIPDTVNGQTFTWHFLHPLKQGASYHLQLKDLNLPATQQLLQVISFTTVSEPKASQIAPVGYLFPGQPIVIKFDQDMPLSDDAIKFNCGGKGNWQDARTFQYLPEALPPGKTCSYTIAKGLKSNIGGEIEADHTYSVGAPGAVLAIGFSPLGGDRPLSSIASITFDQPVDHASAQSLFSISPATTGTFSWSNNTLLFRPTALNYQTTYTIGIASGIKSIYGLTSDRAYSAKFTTLIQVIKLGVPAYKQQFKLSCEEASLRMALAFRGVAVNDIDVLNRVGYDPHPRDTTTNSWDNPYKMYVGDVNGVEGVTGWGVYGGPIAAAAQSFGVAADYVQGISAQQISQAIHSNNPVVLWGMIGNKAVIDGWNTADGLVQVAKNAHVRTVYGVVGSADNPIGFYIHDPIYGDLYWTTQQLIFNMTAGGYLASQGVIVH